jgi:hypothetical protein
MIVIKYTKLCDPEAYGSVSILILAYNFFFYLVKLRPWALISNPEK